MTREGAMGAAVMVAGLLLGNGPPLRGQSIAVDSATAAAAEGLRPTKASTEGVPIPPAADTTAHRRSRLGTASLGFLAGAGAGLVLAHFVNRNKGEGRLENYIGIPLFVGTFTFATVFVAMGD
jgi:hypothetical protein